MIDLHHPSLAATLAVILTCTADDRAPGEMPPMQTQPRANIPSDVTPPAEPPAIDDVPAAPTVPPSPEHKPDPDLSAPPQLAHSGDHFHVTAPSSIYDMTVAPHGVALKAHGTVWHADIESEEIQKIETGTDLHGLASDDRWLYWIGRHGGGRYAYETGERAALKQYAVSGQQHGLAVGDFPYGMAEHGAVWRLERRDISRINPPQEHWLTGSHILAGDGIVVFSVFDDVEMANYLWRVRVGWKGVRLDIQPSCRSCSSLDESGRLLFLQDGEVRILGARVKKPKVLFEANDTSALCWCGPNICSFSKDESTLRRHLRLRAESTVLATEAGDPFAVSCNEKHIAWLTKDDERNTLHIASTVRR